MLVVEYPCDQFCRIEVNLSGERNQVTLQQLRDKADKQHQLNHEPEPGEAADPATEPETPARPATTLFLSAPGSASGTAPSRGSSPRRDSGPRRDGRRR